MRQTLDINHSSTSLAASHMLCCRLTHREVAKKQICPVREGGCASYCSKFHQATSERCTIPEGLGACFCLLFRCKQHQAGAFCCRGRRTQRRKATPVPNFASHYSTHRNSTREAARVARRAAWPCAGDASQLLSTRARSRRPWTSFKENRPVQAKAWHSAQTHERYGSGGLTTMQTPTGLRTMQFSHKAKTRLPLLQAYSKRNLSP